MFFCLGLPLYNIGLFVDLVGYLLSISLFISGFDYFVCLTSVYVYNCCCLIFSLASSIYMYFLFNSETVSSNIYECNFLISSEIVVRSISSYGVTPVSVFIYFLIIILFFTFLWIIHVFPYLVPTPSYIWFNPW